MPTRAFLLAFRHFLESSAPALLKQPVCMSLQEAFSLAGHDSVADDDPRVLDAIAIIQELLGVDTSHAKEISYLPLTPSEIVTRVHYSGSLHSLASYLASKAGLPLENTNVRHISIGPADSDPIMRSQMWQAKLLIHFDSRFTLEQPWYEFDCVVGPEFTEVVFDRSSYAKFGLAFFYDFARNAIDSEWLARPHYRVTLGPRSPMGAWTPLPK